jgi:hypothetical protein
MVPLLDPVESTIPGQDELVRAELWISFVSLLRSHLGALQTSGKLAQAVFSSLTVSSVEVADLSRTLHISLLSASGEGEWSLTRLGDMIAAGTWVLRPDAMVTIDGATAQDMELGVEEFARKLWARTPDPVASILPRNEG